MLDEGLAGAAAAPPHAVEEYLPEPRGRRAGVALCLSGGGFRAALFHLGALRRLAELGVLARVDTLSSVSGGSIVAAHLADRLRPWPAPERPVEDWERRVAGPLRAFCRRNLRTWPLVQRLLPWNWARPDPAVRALAAAYERRLTRLRLSELPARPGFVLCATDLTFGSNFELGRDRIGDYQAGYLRPAPSWPLARAVAASSCFPPVFDPMVLGLRADQLRGGAAGGPKRDALVESIRLSDGGLYDNLGLEPVWKSRAVLLVSDGGATFDFAADRGLLGRLSRYTAVQGRQVSALRKRWLIAGFIAGTLEGTYWGIGSATAHYAAGVPGYSQELVTDLISRVRTDLDAFSAAECAVLENHGYLLTEAAIRKHAPGLIDAGAVAASAPHPDWLDEARVRPALADSGRTVLLGRS
ncbi:MAG TPA: patatin-like phospholipase family protein [Chloroflexota bacterium]|jgi:NTE family protein